MMHHRAVRSLGVLSILLNGWITSLNAYPQMKSNDSIPLEKGGSGDFTWDSIVPSPELVFHQCYGGFECASLQVPLDYLAENPDEAHAYIAIIKYASDPINYPEYSESWGGPILFNPGGPGVSGVGAVLDAGPGLQMEAGSQFSIIGFDPRGVNNSYPAISCFDTPYDRILFNVRRGDRILGSGGGEEVGELFVREKLLGNICTTDEKAKGVQHIGTEYVARDMFAINEAIWDLAPKEVRRKGLQFWGISYGSALGITAATLFPDRIERMIVDGIVDVIDYFSGAEEKTLTDTELVMDSFYEFCFKAGPLMCQFYTGSKPEDIRERLNNLLEALRTQPLPYSIPLDGTSQTELFTYSILRSIVSSWLYAPLVYFESGAELLVFIESSLELGYLDASLGPGPPLTCPSDEHTDFVNSGLLEGESLTAIYCNDIPSFTNLTLADFREYMERMIKQSPSTGPLWATIILPCVGWMSEAPKKPLKFQEAKDTDKWEGAPILFMGNTGDPVTPLANAYSMAKLFPANASAIMVQEGEGHGVHSVPSECMFNAIQTYFSTGEVPPEDQRYCNRLEAPFLGVLSGNPKRSEAVDTMRRVGQQLRETTTMAPRALSLAPFSWSARYGGGSLPHGGW